MTGPWETLRWAAAEVGIAGQAVSLMEQCLTADTHTFGFEVHHDGSGRVDLSVFTDAGPGRHLHLAGLPSFTLGPIDVAEYDITAQAQLAGVFHPVLDGGLAGWPTPLLVAPLTGREGQVRMVFPIKDQIAFDRAASVVALPPAARGLLTGPTSLRLGLDRRSDGFGPRVGLEVFIDPAVFVVDTVLADLGVPADAVASMVRLASRLPLSRSRARDDLEAHGSHDEGQGQRGQDNATSHETKHAGHDWSAFNEGVAFTHFSVSWPTPGLPAVLKSYIMVRCGPQQSRHQLRDAAVRANGRDWTAQIQWAASQLPLRSPDALAQWRAAVDPHSTGAFERRLQRDGLTAATAGAALRAGHDLDDPPWWSTYQHLTASAGEQVPIPEQAWAVPFGPLVWPVVAAVAEGDLWDLRWDLLQRLSRVAAPCLLDLMWRDRPFGARIAAQITPDDAVASRGEFEAFCARHAGDGWTEVLLEYPVLGGQLAIEIDQWRAAATQMLDRIAADRHLIADVFGIPVDAPLDDVSLTGGDSHNAGRTVRSLRFGQISLVYKPRSVRLESLYEAAAAHMSARGVPIAAPTVLDRGEYGYVEYVHRAPAGDYAAFYRNAGGLLALLYALGATDCHQENLIASGDHLVLVDAETLVTGIPAPAAQTSTPQVLQSEIASVLRIGMLPGWLWLEGRRLAVDISALGVGPGGHVQVSNGWRLINTDTMLRGRVDVTVPHPLSLPSPPGVDTPLSRHLDDLVAGFSQAYRVVVQGKDTWVRDCLHSVAQAANRVVLRPTYVYAALLAELVEPAAMRSWQQRAMVLEKLTRALLDEEAAAQWPLLAAEQQALQRGDVPYFQRTLRSGDTVWCDGALLGWPGLDELGEVLSRLSQMGEADLEVQTALIRATVVASGFRMSTQPIAPASRGPAQPASLVSRRCFDATRTSPMLWVGPTLLPDGERATVRSVGFGLYDGRLGFAVACAVAGETTPPGTLDPVLPIAGDPQALSQVIQSEGFGLAGVGGLLRGLDVLGYGDVINDALHVVLTRERVTSDRRLDLILGVAGLIAPLIRRPGFERIVAAAADVLVTAQDTTTGAWVTLPGTAPLTGLAHGAAGISMALVQAGVALGRQEYVDAALLGLDYEAQVFDAEQGNWPDFRDAAGAGFMMGWCAGAPGIALSRHVLVRLLPDHDRVDRWLEERERGLDATAAGPLLARDHLCCGNAARIAILRALGRSSQADAIADAVTSRPDLPVPMLPLAEPTLPMRGLFTGLPGIGLTLSAGSDWVEQILI